MWALMLGFAASAFAFEPVAPDEEGIEIDQAVQVLKEEATLLERDAGLAKDAFLFPPETSLTVYLSNKVSDLLLSKVQLSIDGKVAAEHKYDEYSSRAILKKGALQPLTQMNVNNGPHRLLITFEGANIEGEPAQGRYEAAFDKGLEPGELEIEILRGARKGPAAMRIRQWKATQP